MRVVLDTSAAVELLLQRKNAKALAQNLAEAEWVQVPTLFTTELVNVFWKYHQFQKLPAETCEKLISQGLALPDHFADERDLWTESFDLACQTAHPVYDIVYLVLARRHSAHLLTEDKKLKRLAEKSGVRIFS